MAKKKDFTEEVRDFQNQMQEIREQMNALVGNTDMNYVEFKQNKAKVGMKRKKKQTVWLLVIAHSKSPQQTRLCLKH